jgi:hypothetical protein
MPSNGVIMTSNNNVHRGQQRDKPFRDALRLEIAAAGQDHKALRQVARALLVRAQDGDVRAIQEIGDRMDGKVPRSLVGDDQGDPITLTIVTGVERASDRSRQPQGEGGGKE